MPFQNDERDSHPGWKAERTREEKIVKAIRVHEFGGPALVAGLECGTLGPVVGQELRLAEARGRIGPYWGRAPKVRSF